MTKKAKWLDVDEVSPKKNGVYPVINGNNFELDYCYYDKESGWNDGEFNDAPPLTVVRFLDVVIDYNNLEEEADLKNVKDLM